MINFLIAVDNLNATLGIYFEDCQEDIRALLDENTQLIKTYTRVPSHQCNVAYIDITLPQINSNPFIFIAYAHGKDKGLQCCGSFFISTDNCSHLKNSFFYSTACLIGKKFAPELIESGCKAFIGFYEETEVFENPTYRQIFIECDNYALKMFLTTDATIGQSFDSMKNHYTNKIDYLSEIGEDVFLIANLVANREALICLGNDDLKKEDFFVNKA